MCDTCSASGVLSTPGIWGSHVNRPVRNQSRLQMLFVTPGSLILVGTGAVREARAQTRGSFSSRCVLFLPSVTGSVGL